MKIPFEHRTVKASPTLAEFWDVNRIDDDGLLFTKNRCGCVFEVEGIDGSFLSPEQLVRLHNDWRSVLRLIPGEELQIVFRKRVEFAKWVEAQLSQTFLAHNPYGKKILLDRLAEQVAFMGDEEPRLLSQKILVCFWTDAFSDETAIREKKSAMRSQLSSFGFAVKGLIRSEIEREINVSSQDLSSSELREPEWPSVKIEGGRLLINGDQFRAIELSKLPESFTELGMIQSLTSLPYPIDICVRLRARDVKPIISRLEKKRNLLNAKRSGKRSPVANVDSQVDQIDHVLRNFADQSEAVFDLKMTVGLRMPVDLTNFQQKALANIVRKSAKMDFCDFEECTIGTFDSYLECIPGFSGSNIQSHTVLGSNAIHFLPFFRPGKGDQRAVITFQTRSAGLYGIDPVDPHLANYNWLVSGTSGAGKSFFVNSLLAQSASLNPNIFIVDIGGSYNKLTEFLGGRVMSLEPGRGFELSPFFLPKATDENEEQVRRRHIFQIYLEMVRIDGSLPSVEIRHLLLQGLISLFEMDRLPEYPTSTLIDALGEVKTSDSERLKLLLQPWSRNGFFGQFLDNNKPATSDGRILTFDLKGLTEFEDLSRVVQLIVCASLWARIRRTGTGSFSWIILDEVAFSLFKTQPQFVDELVSTMRKYFAGAVIVVQDLEKVTSNLAGSSILQNTESKAILQQRGDPRNYSDALALNQIDLWAIESLRREKGAFSEIFLIRDDERTVIRHVPSELEYWLSTTAPEDNREMKTSIRKGEDGFQKNVMEFVARGKGAR